MILAGPMQIIYPRDEQLCQAVTPLAEELRQYIQDNGTLGGDPDTLTASGGKTYLVNIYEAPSSPSVCAASLPTAPLPELAAGSLRRPSWCWQSRLCLLYWYSPSSGQPPGASTQLLHRLCREAERIGGSFTEIDGAIGQGRQLGDRPCHRPLCDGTDGRAIGSGKPV